MRWIYVAAMTQYDVVEDWRRTDYCQPIPPSEGLVHVVRLWAVGARARRIRQPKLIHDRDGMCGRHVKIALPIPFLENDPDACTDCSERFTWDLYARRSA
jgi:hypothetical protein